MPVASHTLSWSVNVTNALKGVPGITAVQITLNTDSVNDAIAQALLALGGADQVATPGLVNTSTVTYV